MEKPVTFVTRRTRIISTLAAVLAMATMAGAGVAAADDGAQPNHATASVEAAPTPIDPNNPVILAEKSVDEFAAENNLTPVRWVNLSGADVAYSACGPAYSHDAYFFCGYQDADTAYIGLGQAERFNSGTNRLAGSLLVAHEWGHHLQYAMTKFVGDTSAMEDGADCVGGAWLAWYNNREGLNLNVTDAIGFWHLAKKIGNNTNVPDTHGAPLTRGAMMAMGFVGGLHACNAITPTVPN